MSKTNKKRKSTNKYKKLDISRLVPVIAIVEVIVLVAVTTFAWYFFNASKSMSSGVVTVNADSGLEIDFQDADKTSFIDIFDYVDIDEFSFEPASSVDGRNIYFPTSGTFGNTETENMVFRDGTINDINSKYINIDFKLTNNDPNNQAMQVYLSHNSFFHIKERGKDTTVNGKALRMALYNNDGNTGNVDSDIINNINNNKEHADSATSADRYTIYLKTSTWSSGVNAFIWDSYGETNSNGSVYSYVDVNGVTHYLKNDETTDTTDRSQAGNIHQQNTKTQAWPGAVCSKSEDLYSLSFENPYKSISVERHDSETGKNITYTYVSETDRLYDSIIFNNGSEQTVDIKFFNQTTQTQKEGNGNCYKLGSKNNENKYTVSTSSNADDTKYKTVYFLKPTDWGDNAPLCKVSTSSIGDNDLSGAAAMTQVATAIYSYTFPVNNSSNTSYNHVRFKSGSNNNKSNDRNISSDEIGGKSMLYYFPSDAPDGKVSPITFSSSNIYFYNTLGWDQPYAHVNAFPAGDDDYLYEIPMIALSGNLYYCPLATPFLYDVINTSTETYVSTSGTKQVSSLANNCEVYFTDSKDGSTASQKVKTYGNNIYRLTSEGGTPTNENYSDELSVGQTSYAVISPGVSAGFQRAANPVNEINYSTGAVESILPTFASSFDDFLMGSNNPVFTIGAGQTVNMSMIIWLEGTDSHCTGANYAGKDINLYLEFSTVKAGDSSDGTFSYRFIDATREHWTSDTETNEATGVSVSPVMQLYDMDDDRGYLMHSETNTYYDGKEKVYTWTCQAPQSLVYSDHEFEFRRVNPYNEDQIWNRWQAGQLSNFRTYALEQSTRSVNFTAFGDGSPDPTIAEANGFTVPAKSCGGLWGRHKTDSIIVYDGRKNRSIGENHGVLNMCLKYTYPNSGPSVDIEIKASNIGGNILNSNKSENDFTGFYEIIVPYDVYEQSSHVEFRNYRNCVEKEAINSIANTTVTLDHRWTDDTGHFDDGIYDEAVIAPFFEIDTEDGHNDDSHCYWGSDVVYVQVSNNVGDSFGDSSGFNQMKFHNDANANEKLYSYMYQNDFFKDSGYKASFVAVVPVGYMNGNNETYYTKFTMERCGTGNNHANVFRESGAEALQKINQSDATPLHGRIYVRAYDGNRLMKINADKITLYYHADKWNDDKSDPGKTIHYEWPVLHVYGGKDGDNTFSMYDTGRTDGYNKKIVTATIWSNDSFQFKFVKDNDDNNSKFSVERDARYSNGTEYWPKGWYSDKVDLDKYDGPNGNTVDKTTDSNGTSASSAWPHYTEKIVDPDHS
ncbi:hypothetical protein [Ruminococcus sp.]|uniref:hypothetical protein n=1 Tax=Ruminococcus sp. TaxID=41978 RepID=UPI002E80C40B|nr:hypothetical protein [Ruminococcus sp.]MEE3492255.1 hypothetical protein [Ruminococcus sp.]